MNDMTKTNSATGGDGFQPASSQNSPLNPKNSDSLAPTVPPYPKLLRAPAKRDIPSQTCYLTPDEIWAGVADHILETTDEAAYEIEHLDYHLKYLTPRAVDWYKRDLEADGITNYAFNSAVPGDEEDEQNVRNDWHEATLEKAAYQAKLARYGFWRQAILFGVEESELTIARAIELMEIAREFFKDRKDWEWAGLRPQMLIEAMEVRA